MKPVLPTNALHHFVEQRSRDVQRTAGRELVQKLDHLFRISLTRTDRAEKDTNRAVNLDPHESHHESSGRVVGQEDGPGSGGNELETGSLTRVERERRAQRADFNV